MTTKPRDIDGGWAWFVLAASYFNILLCSGLGYLAGVFQVVFLEQFGGSVAMTSWVNSLFSSLMQLAGPMSSVVSNSFGCRTSVMLGGLFIALGLFMSSMANSLGLLMFSFGLLSGTGLGLIYSASIVVVSFYFDKRRTFVNGLVLSAGGLGFIITPQLVRILLESFSWREALSILAGIAANSCVCGALMFSMHERLGVKDRYRKVIAFWKRRCTCFGNINDNENKSKCNDDAMLSYYGDAEDDGGKITYEMDEQTQSKLLCPSDTDTVTPEDILNSYENIADKAPIKRTDNDEKLDNGENHEHLVQKIPKLQHSKLYKNSRFWVLCLSLFISNAGCGVFNVHMPSFLKSQGLTGQEVTNVMSMNGLAILFGRCLVGALANSLSGNDLLFFSTMHIIGGFFMCAMSALGTSYIPNMLIIFGIGSYAGTVYAVLPTLTIELVGLNKLATAFGIEMVSAGIGYLVSPPISGILVDLTGGYEYSILCGGLLFILAGLVLWIIPCMTSPKPKS